MGTREFVILLLGFAIVVVVLRGLFVAIQARRGQIKLAIDSNIPHVDLDALELSELPNGGARIVTRPESNQQYQGYDDGREETEGAKVESAGVEEEVEEQISRYHNKLQNFDDFDDHGDQVIPVLMDAVEVRDESDDRDLDSEQGWDEDRGFNEASELVPTTLGESGAVHIESAIDVPYEDSEQAVKDLDDDSEVDDFEFSSEPQLGNGFIESSIENEYVTPQEPEAIAELEETGELDDLIDYQVHVEHDTRGADNSDGYNEIPLEEREEEITSAEEIDRLEQKTSAEEFIESHVTEAATVKAEQDNLEEPEHQEELEGAGVLSFEEQLGDFSFSAGDRIGEFNTPTNPSQTNPSQIEAAQIESQFEAPDDSEKALTEYARATITTPLDQSELFDDEGEDEGETETFAKEEAFERPLFEETVFEKAVFEETVLKETETRTSGFEGDWSDAAETQSHFSNEPSLHSEDSSELTVQQHQEPIEAVNDFADTYDQIDVLTEGLQEGPDDIFEDEYRSEGTVTRRGFSNLKSLVPGREAGQAAGKAAGNLFKSFSSAINSVAGSRDQNESGDDPVLEAYHEDNTADLADSIPDNVTNIAEATSAESETAELNAELEGSKTAVAAGPSEVILLNVMAPNGYAFLGEELFRTLSSQGIEFGDMDIFHCRDNASVQRPVIFSVANMVNPGTFELSNLAEFTSPGISFFLALPSPINNLEAFDSMLANAQQIASRLGGELKDDQRNGMTAQTIEHYRQRIRDFELQRLRVVGLHR